MTKVTVHGEDFYIDGEITYKGKDYHGHRIEGLLINSRMVQALFDDENPETRPRWAYPDTGQWDPERNLNEFLAALPIYREHGLLAVTINLQGGSPEGYSKQQPWINTAFEGDGTLKDAYLSRLDRILEKTDELGIVVILGQFYFGQDQHLSDEAAVKYAVKNAIEWILQHNYQHVLVEINNECDVRSYTHEILKPQRVPELIQQAQHISHEGKRLLVGTSYKGGSIPGDEVIQLSDFILMHGNGVSDSKRIIDMVDIIRTSNAYEAKPILFNEDDHFDFEETENNFLSAVSRHASWGYFDPGESDYEDGYQCLPVNWGLSTPRKQAFFTLVKQMTD